MDQGKAYNQSSKTQYQMGDLLDVGITSIDTGKRRAEFYPCQDASVGTKKNDRSTRSAPKGKRKTKGHSRVRKHKDGDSTPKSKKSTKAKPKKHRKGKRRA